MDSGASAKAEKLRFSSETQRSGVCAVGNCLNENRAVENPEVTVPR